MKTVFSTNSELAHVWAQQNQDQGRANSMFFEGPTIYSYGHHFCIARFVSDRVVFFTTRDYSNTTVKHKNLVRRAFLRVSPYSIFLEVDLHYTDRAPDKNGVSSCSYYGLNTYIWGMSSNTPAEFEPYPLVTEQELTEAEATLEKLQHEHREMGYKINQLKNFLGV